MEDHLPLRLRQDRDGVDMVRLVEEGHLEDMEGESSSVLFLLLVTSSVSSCLVSSCSVLSRLVSSCLVSLASALYLLFFFFLASFLLFSLAFPTFTS